MNLNPLAWALSGNTRCPRSRRSSASSPASRCRTDAGILNRAGRCKTQPRARAKASFCTGAGAVPFTAPLSCGVAMICAISRMRSSRSIQEIHCSPLPMGPPRPNSNGTSRLLSIPASMPSTIPMRSRTTRTPNFSALLAAHSQASQTRWPKQRLPPSNSVSDSSAHVPYHPIAEPLIITAGRRCRRAIRRTTSRVMRNRDARIRRRFVRVHRPLATGSPAKFIIVSIAASSAI